MMIELAAKIKSFQDDSLIRDYAENDMDEVDFTSNDYLNLSTSSNLGTDINNIISRYGFSSKGSAAVCGYTALTKEFEEKFSDFVGCEESIFFNCGYMANIAIYSTIFNSKDTIFADKNIHASTIDGILLSKAKLKRYKHQDIKHLVSLYDNESYISTEGLFSTSGRITNLAEVAKLSNKIILDEAHSFGVLGDSGRELINKHGLDSRTIPIAIYPLGKAFASTGAIISTTHEIAQYIRQFSRSYIYTTALPAFILHANIIQLENLKNASMQRSRLFENIKYFNKVCLDNNIGLDNHDISPIRAIVLDDNIVALNIKNELHKNKISVSCFRYPTVPKNTPFIRFSLHSNNTTTEIDKAIEIIKRYL